MESNEEIKIVINSKRRKAIRIILKFAKYLILIIGVLFILQMRNSSEAVFTADAEENYETYIQSKVSELESRINIYTDSLYTIRGLLYFDKNLTVTKWNNYINSLGLFDRYPGQVSIGYSEYVPNSKLADFKNSLRTVYPLTYQDIEFKELTNQSKHYIVKFASPELSSYKVGYDLSYDPLRLAAITESIDEGEKIATPPVTILGTSRSNSGLTIYLPIYDTNIIPDTVEKRREKIKGMVAVGIDIEKLVFDSIQRYIKGEKMVSMVVTDVDEFGKEVVLIDDMKTVSDRSGFISYETKLNIAGRKWSFEFWSPRDQFINESMHKMLDNLTIAYVIIVVFAFVGATRQSKMRDSDNK